MNPTALDGSSVHDALWESIAVLDEHGTIVSTNSTWATFAALNGGQVGGTGAGVAPSELASVGANYIDVCERSGAQFVANGLRSILSHECQHFDANYACPSPLEDRWFLLQVAQCSGGAIVTHSNVTAQLMAAERDRLAPDDDQLTGLPTLPTGLRLLEEALTEAAVSGVRVMVATVRMPLLADLTLSHGRLARDSVLVQIAARVRRLMRTGDFLVRSGPAAFLLVARQVDDRDGDQLLEELGQVLTPKLQVGPFQIAPAASVEVVTSNAVSTVDALLQHRPAQTRVRSAISATREAALVEKTAPPDISGVIVGSPLPMMVFSLPDQRVRAANRAAADLFGLTPGELSRRHAKDLLQPIDSGKVTLDLSALNAGALDSYRARRTLVGTNGNVDAWIWVRAIPRRSGAMALLLVLPADHDDQFQLPTRALMGPLAVDLASGTMDDSGAIITLSRSNAGVLQSQRDGPAENRQLITHVHQHDQSRLAATLDQFRLDRRNVVIAVRIRHAHRGWVTSDCHLFATGDDNTGEPIGFVLAEATPDAPASGRVAQLELHLSRIAAEARAAGLEVGTPEHADARPVADLGPLTPRQREIVERLLDGQRVPTIAAALYVSRSTVRNHLAGVYRAFEVHSQSDLLELLRPAS